MFTENSWHRFNKIMANCFYSAVQRIKNNYKGDASLIWKDNLSGGIIMHRFMQFDGVGEKIASMATNCLLREYKIPLKDLSRIDISADVHIKRVFARLGFVQSDPTIEEIIYTARVMHPDYPGVFDLPTWEIGKEWCRPTNPSCNDCSLSACCKRLI